MELENITKTIHQKIQKLTGEYFPLESDFDEQMIEIRKHYLAALEGQFKPKDLQNSLKMNEHASFGIESAKLRETVINKFNQTFLKTDSWVHNNFNIDKNNHLFYHLLSPDWKNEIVRCNPFYNLKKHQWTTIEKAIKYLKSEELNKVTKYFVNIVDSQFNLLCFNSYGLEYNFTLLIYLITSERIITTYINKEKVILSTEHIIKKDLKKVEIVDETKVLFHYHGLHNADVLYVDSYEQAVEVRKRITELRENKFNKP